DLSNHVVDVPLTELVNGSSRVGISTQGVVASVREDCGIIMRCTQCRRVLRDGNCNQHGDDEGNQDVRLRLVIDDGMSTSSLLINKEATLNLLNTTEEKIKAEIDSDGQIEFVQRLRGKLLGRLVIASGRTIVDEQGAMILADKTELVEQDPGLISTEIRAQWGVQ
ncbi:MAG: hypothetical protein HOI28_05285, partial [Euryarchaeota archaeon]|nr:hypothetical protein [Euryarchaeota archaeon]